MLNWNRSLVASPASPDMDERPPVTPGCTEWRDILQAYPAAMQNYCQAVMSLLSLDAATFNDGWAKAEQARKVCENYRERLFHHRHEHGCFTSRGS